MRQLVERPPRDKIDEAELAAYDDVVEMCRLRDADRDAYPSLELFGALLNSPTFTQRLMQLATSLAMPAGNEPLPGRVREWADMVVSIEAHRSRPDPESGCALRVLYNHLPAAAAAGIRLPAIEALWEGREETLTDEERLLAAYVSAVLAGAVSDEMFRAVEDRLGRRWTLEYAAFALLVQYVLRLAEIAGCPNATPEQINARLEELGADSRATPLNTGGPKVVTRDS